MSYLTTNKKLVGKYVIKTHAIDRIKERYGDKYIGNKKIKNMNSNRVKRLIRKRLNNDIKFVSDNDDGTVYVETGDFGAIVDPSFQNFVVTII